MNGRVFIGGLGSTVMGDDGIGPRLIAMLEERCTFPENVDIVDIGTPGLGLMSFIIGYDTVVLIDAVHDAGAPGSVKIYSREDLLKRPLLNRVSPHDPAVSEALLTADMLGEPIDTVVLIGIIPERCSLSTEMTETMKKRTEELFRFTIDTLHALGIAVQWNVEIPEYA